MDSPTPPAPAATQLWPATKGEQAGYDAVVKASAAQETAKQWWHENATKFHWCQDWWGGDEAEALCGILEAYAASLRAEVARLQEYLNSERLAHEEIANILLPLVGTDDGTSVGCARKVQEQVARLKKERDQAFRGK